MPGAVVGAIVGGVIGHQVGGGRGRDVATAGGAVAGAAVGANVGRDDRDDEEGFTTSFVASCKPTGASSSTYEDRGRSNRCSVRSRRIEESGGSNVAVD